MDFIALFSYLRDTFFTEEQLLQHCQCQQDDLSRLQNAGLMPKPSYVLTLDANCKSFLADTDVKSTMKFYAKGYVSWLNIVLNNNNTDEIYALFVQRYKDTLAYLSTQGFCSKLPKFNQNLDEHLIQEWSHFLAGTYGSCTKNGLPEFIATKELATELIKNYIEFNENDGSGSHELKAAVDLLDSVSAEFAPNERENSSRQRLIVQVRRDYQLN